MIFERSGCSVKFLKFSSECNDALITHKWNKNADPYCVVCRELSLFATEWLTKVHGKRSQRSARVASRQLSSSRLDCAVLSLVRRNIRSPFL